jgi:hypothetical protein
MIARSDTVLDEYQRPVPGALIYVYNIDGTAASLTSDGVTTLVQPIVTDEFGGYSYQANVGYYREDIWFGGKLRYQQNNIAVGSPGADLALRSDLAASTGALLVNWIASGTGAILRTVLNKLRDTVSVDDYGADPTGVADSLAAFNLAFATGKKLTLNEGTYVLSSYPTAPTGTMCIRGAGKGKTSLAIAHNGARALYFMPASVNNRIELSGFSLVADFASGPCPLGIEIAFPSTTSYPYSQVEIDVNFVSNLGNTTAPYAQTWGRGIRLANVWYPKLSVNGSSAPIPSDTGNTGFLEVTGGSFGMVGAEIDAVWYYGADGIRCSAYTEALKLSPGTEFVGVTKGVYVPATTPLGGAAATYRSAFMDLGYAHIAASSIGVDLDTVLDFKMERSVERWGTGTGWIGIKLNQVLYPKLHCRISGNGSGVSSTGIVATGGNCAHGIVTNVHFDNLDTQFTLDSSTSHWVMRSNVATGTTPDAFTIAGTNHDIEWFDTNGFNRRTLNGAAISGSVYSAVGELGKVNAAGVTYTAAEFLSDAIFRSGAATVSDTTPTAAQIVAAIPGAVVGTGKRITINNQNSGVLTLVAGTGVTLVGTTTVANAFARNYLIRITNATVGSEAVRLIGLQTGAI